MSTPLSGGYSEATMQNSRKLFGFAVSTDPFEIYEESGSPLPSRMAVSVTRRVVTLYNEGRSSRGLEPANDAVIRLLLNGIDQTQTFLQPLLRQRSAAEAREYVKSDDVCQTLAALALRGDDDELNGISALLNMQGSAYRFITDASNKINPQLRAWPTDKTRGCPFAGHSGEVKVSPTFRRFIPWAGSLAIAPIEAHNLRDRSAATAEA